MTLRVVGAGLGRTGTLSLKIALERLLGAPCHHMMELFGRPEQVPVWHAAARGEMPDWNEFLARYQAVVDWPAAAFWRELSEAFPEALVLLSVRDPDSWWKSASDTIFPEILREQTRVPPGLEGWQPMVRELLGARFDAPIENRQAATAAFEAHNGRVRETIAANRLLEWRAGDGWEPICEALSLPVPDEPFPRTNSTSEFIARREAHDPKQR